MIPKKLKVPEINLADYTYDLPDEKIAKYPLTKRDSSKLLFTEVSNSQISHRLFADLPDLLPENSCLIFNDSKVILSRIEMKKQTGGRAEVLLLNPLGNLDPQIAMTQKNNSKWEAIIGGKKIKQGDILSNKINNIELNIEFLQKEGNEAQVNLSWNDDNLTLAQILEKVGEIPLPPYLNREAEPNDKQNYQTVYAENDGSVAAPTAGLHFTKKIIGEIKSKNVDTINLTLHVGAGTFLPISSEKIDEHKMHAEQVFVPKNIIENILTQIKSGKRIIAVGTTSVRTLESIAIFGENLLLDRKSDFLVNQWDSYQNPDINIIDSFEKVLEYLDKNNLDELSGQTKLLILPGYKFRLVSGIVTNFHQPSSTLLLLVGAFLGRDLWKKSYEKALSNNYRFLSYGDSSLLLK
jgi:S-adenosylmethionine:tRNA ribosyltransferase-isomerase